MVDLHPSHCLSQPQCQGGRNRKKKMWRNNRDFPNNENNIPTHLTTLTPCTRARTHTHTHKWELDHKKPVCQRTDAFKLWRWRRLFLGLQGDQTSQSSRKSWIFTGRTDAEAEAPIFWPPDVNSWLTGK